MNLASIEKHFDFEPGSRIGIAKCNIDIPFMDGVNPGISVTSFKKGEAIETYYDTSIWPGFLRWKRPDAKTAICVDIETGSEVLGIKYTPRSEGRTITGTSSSGPSNSEPYSEDWFEHLRRCILKESILVDKSKKEVGSDNARVFECGSSGLHFGPSLDTLSQLFGKAKVVKEA